MAGRLLDKKKWHKKFKTGPLNRWPINRRIVPLKRWPSSPRHHPQSNHYGMQVGGVLVTMLCISGDPGVDQAKLDPLIEKSKLHMRKSILQGHGSQGYYPGHPPAG